MLRSGPAITAHFAHRPRQSCRTRPGRPPVRRLRLEQLTLFDLDLDLKLELDPIPTFYWEPAPIESRPTPEPQPVRRSPGRRRKAWLPRLVRWVKAKAARFSPEG